MRYSYFVVLLYHNYSPEEYHDSLESSVRPARREDPDTTETCGSCCPLLSLKTALLFSLKALLKAWSTRHEVRENSLMPKKTEKREVSKVSSFTIKVPVTQVWCCSVSFQICDAGCYT